jgi:hypothetical protein
MLAIGDSPMYAAMFILVGFLTSFFSKNMIVILVVAIAVTNLVSAGASPKHGLEGATDQTALKEDADETSKDAAPKKADDSKTADDSKKADSKTADSVKKDMVNDGKELLKLQEQIVDGFQEIQPYMNKAEELAGKIEQSANALEQIKGAKK